MISIVKEYLNRLLDSHQKRPLVVGINGPQGSGKTTLTSFLSSPTVIAMSLDDFYLKFEEQRKLSIENKSNELLEWRGNPSTHDMKLLQSTLEALMNHQTSIKIPKYDKSLHAGKGDRLPETEWIVQESSPEIILLEGWCLGFQSQSLMDLKEICEKNLIDFNKMVRINRALDAFQPIYCLFDAFIQIYTSDIQNVYHWRWEQEQSLKKRLGEDVGLTFEQTKAFVDRFMPVYHIYLPELTSMGLKSIHEMLQIEIDADRQVKGHQILKMMR
jgi:D-glycerate 3-kinase